MKNTKTLTLSSWNAIHAPPSQREAAATENAAHSTKNARSHTCGCRRRGRFPVRTSTRVATTASPPRMSIWFGNCRNSGYSSCGRK